MRELPDIVQIERALHYISSNERDVWIRMGMALKNAYGDAGFSVWDRWSQTSAKYSAKDCRAQWRSISAQGGITIGSLISAAKNAGFRFDTTRENQPKFVKSDKFQRKREAAEKRQRERRAHAAAKKATEQTQTASIKQDHVYFTRKGLSDVHSLVDDKTGDLLVTMYATPKTIVAVQRINAYGAKKFWPAGCSVSGAYHAIGNHLSPDAIWLCEGLADGICIQRALKERYRDRDLVAVCFSASNIIKVADSMRSMFGKRMMYVVADGDEVGVRYAFKTKLPVAYPKDETEDPASLYLKDSSAMSHSLLHLSNHAAMSKFCDYPQQSIECEQMYLSMPNRAGEHIRMIRKEKA